MWAPPEPESPLCYVSIGRRDYSVGYGPGATTCLWWRWGDLECGLLGQSSCYWPQSWRGYVPLSKERVISYFLLCWCKRLLLCYLWRPWCEMSWGSCIPGEPWLPLSSPWCWCIPSCPPVTRSLSESDFPSAHPILMGRLLRRGQVRTQGGTLVLLPMGLLSTTSPGSLWSLDGRVPNWFH